MKIKEEYVTLRNLLRWDMPSEVKEFLIENSNIDVLYDNGCFFKLASASDTTNLLSILLDYYYDQNDLRQKPETYNTEQQLAKHKLFEILQEAVISEEMQKVLDEYGLVQNDDNSSNYSNEEIENLFIKKSHSMDDIRNHSNGKNSYSTHEHSDEELLATEKVAADLEFIKFKNDLLGHKIANLDEKEQGVAGHLEDSTEHHSD
jgi:hypothetical protein